MKKVWHAPSIETLDVRMTENGDMYWPEEGTVIFRPEQGAESEIIEVGPTPS